jgi:lipopolysaccharide/colanic/teichoic acid biosynthesis glycosyltransferase
MNTFFIVFAVVILLCCVGPMIFMRRRHGKSRKNHKPDTISRTDSELDR